MVVVVLGVFIEQVAVYGLIAIFIASVLYFYLKREANTSKRVLEKISEAKVAGLYEPVSLHPVIDLNTCIKSGACVRACPEEDILGIMNGGGAVINASRCVGHGACFHACPVEAITLCIGTEKRGVDLPHVNPSFETNIEGIYIAGELGGMGLIKNAVEQGRQAMENIASSLEGKGGPVTDVLIIGAGPAGIAATLMAKKMGLTSITLEQESLGGTVFTFPRAKVVMTSPMDLPLYGKVKLYDTSKSELLDIWTEVIEKHKIEVLEKKRVESVVQTDIGFEVHVADGSHYTAKRILLAIGRRGTPRKLDVPGEMSEKVAYRLLEPENIKDKDVLVVGGGDSAIESALLLASENRVTLSYRKDKFSRIKPKNLELIMGAIEGRLISMQYNTNVKEIEPRSVTLVHSDGREEKMDNDLVYVFAGGILPTTFLESMGIKVTKKFGDAILKHPSK